MHNKGNNLVNNDTSSNGSTSKLNISLNSNNSPISSNAIITTDRIEWSRATILDFIEDYRRQRVLWDPNTKGYHIKQTKYEALKLLGLKYGAEIRSIRSKIKSLRSSFHREHGKVLNGRRKGVNYQPMWFAYDAIRFILDGESGDSDEAETQKNDLNNRVTALSEPKYSNNNSSNNISNPSIDEELLEERKISNRDIEHFNNHFLALGLQARHPMAVIAAVEAAAAASAAQERQQDQKYALKQQEIDSATQLKLLELSTNAATTPPNANTTNNDNNTMNLTSTSATFNPISKPFNSPKPSTPLATITSVSVTTATLSSSTTTTTATPPPQQQHQLPPPSLTSTCSLESLSMRHGSRSLDENSVSALASAAAIPSLSITAVARNSDFDSSEYCNISADDVKAEIFESDTTELLMLGSACTSTPVPLNYHKNATDLTVNKGKSGNIVLDSGNNTCDGGSRIVGSRKRKRQMHSNVNVNEDAPSPSKLHQKQQQQQQQQQQLQHSNVTHSKQSNFLNGNINNYQNPDDNEDDDNDGDDDDDDGAGYSTSFSHLQTTLTNSNSNNNNLTSSNNNKASNSNTAVDEYGVFGEYVAITIRKLKTSKAKIVVKHLINNLLYEAEMGKYDQGISSCKEPPELYKM